MRLSEDLQKQFAEKGVSVRYYPERDFADFQKRVWQREYEYSYNYSKNSEFLIDGVSRKKTETELHKDACNFADGCVYGKYARSCDATEYDILYIEYDEKLIMQKINGKYKEVTAEYVQKLIDKNEKAYSGVYGAFALKMQKLVKAAGYGEKLSVYPTTYGIGVWRLYNWHLNKEAGAVEEILNRYGVEYYNELSDAGWVLRFKISKKKENLAKVA